MSITPRSLLFNHITNDTSAHWAVSYTNGNYLGPNYIVSGYTGEWIIIKLINPIILTKFRFLARPDLPTRTPSLWRCYGSNDGINFEEIKEASNDTTSLTLGNYPSNVYQQLLTTFNIPYLYIGFTIKKLVGNINILNFAEIELFGKEELDYTYVIRTLNSYNDGFDSQYKDPVLYLGDDLRKNKNPSYHKLISQNQNQISLTFSDEIDKPNKGIRDDIDFGMVLHIKDYGDQHSLQNF